MPTFNKIDMLNCCRGYHDFSEGEEDAPLECLVCGCTEVEASKPASAELPAKMREPAPVAQRYPSPTYRDHLAPSMRESMVFEYYEVRPCIELGNVTESYQNEAEWEAMRLKIEHEGEHYNSFWTVYGRYDDGHGAFLAQAIGDFNSKGEAFEVMNAIIGLPAAARWMLESQCGQPMPVPPYADGAPRELKAWAHDLLDDMINQSTRESDLDADETEG